MPHTTTLNPSEALERLIQAITRDAPAHARSVEDQGTLTEIVGILDGHPRAIDAVARAIDSSSLRQVYTKLKHGLLSDILDPDEWGFAWQDFGAEHQSVLCAAVCCEAGFDAEAITAIADVLEPEPLLEELVDQAWITAREDGSGWHMRWSTRQLVMKHMHDIHTWSSAHAQHFLERFERHDAITSEFDQPNLEHVLAFGMIHDGDIAARTALALFYIKSRSAHTEELINMIEAVMIRRPCLPGDVLGLSLLGRLGELYRVSQLFEKSVETLELALALDPPQDNPLYGGLHMALALGLAYHGDLKRARQIGLIAQRAYLDLGLEMHAQDALSMLASLHALAWDYEEAERAFDTLVTQDDTGVTVWINLGAVCTALGRHQKARRCLEHVLDMISSVPNDRSELSALNNLISVDLFEEKRELAEVHMARLDDLYDTLGSKLKSRALSLLNHAFYAQKYTTLLDSYHMLSEVLQEDPHQCDALAMRSAIASYQGDLTRAEHDLNTLRQPTIKKAYLIAEWTRYAECALALGHIIHAHESHRLEPLRVELDSMLTTTYSCLLQACHSDLNARVSKLLDPESMLRVHPEGLHARRGTCDMLDLSRSHVTRKLLLTLVAHHRAHSGDPCAIQTLFGAAWPEQVWNLSARTRLHTAMHRLREKLLGELLVTHEDEKGYSLSTRCQVLLPDS